LRIAARRLLHPRAFVGLALRNLRVIIRRIARPELGRHARQIAPAHSVDLKVDFGPADSGKWPSRMLQHAGFACAAAEETRVQQRRFEAMANKVTEEVQTQICAMVGVGCSLRTASKLAGCPESTVRSKLRSNRAFAARLRKAEQHRELVCLRHVQLAGQKNWRAAAWLLERANPVDYGPPKPEVMKPHQVDRILKQFAEIIMKGISNADERREVVMRIKELTGEFKKLAADEWERKNLGGS
jgi:hypothetical protein